MAANLRKHFIRKRLLCRCGINGLFTQHGFTADRPQLVDQRQQHHRHIAVAILQSFKVIRKLHDALHQQRKSIVGIRHVTVRKGERKTLHFLRQTCSAGQLDHIENAGDLMQVAAALTQRGNALTFLDEAFE